MKIEGMEVEYGSDLKQFGTIDDGSPFIGEVFYVAVVHPEGHRWTLRHRFPGVKVEYDEEYQPHFLDIRPQMRHECERIVRRVKERGEIDMALWEEGRPCYGSQAYQEYGQLNELLLERMEG